MMRPLLLICCLVLAEANADLKDAAKSGKKGQRMHVAVSASGEVSATKGKPELSVRASSGEIKEHAQASKKHSTVRSSLAQATPDEAAPTQKPNEEPQPVPKPEQREAKPAEKAPADPSGPVSKPEQKEAPAKKEEPPADTPAKKEDIPPPVQAQAAESAEVPGIFRWIVVFVLVASFGFVSFMLRERILEMLPASTQEKIYEVRTMLGLETALRESRLLPQGPRKRMGTIERADSSLEYSAMRQAAYVASQEGGTGALSETPSQSDADNGSSCSEPPREIKMTD